MAILRAKAFFTVTAGVIPGELMPEYTKSWNYIRLHGVTVPLARIGKRRGVHVG